MVTYKQALTLLKTEFDKVKPKTRTRKINKEEFDKKLRAICSSDNEFEKMVHHLKNTHIFELYYGFYSLFDHNFPEEMGDFLKVLGKIEKQT